VAKNSQVKTHYSVDTDRLFTGVDPLRVSNVVQHEKNDMRLADFILQDMENILARWEAFAACQLPAAAHMQPLALRDHAEQILQAIRKDLATYQSRQAQTQKSLGGKAALVGAPETAAQTHAVLRAKSGFNINQLAAEYRALRASVLRLWTDAYPLADPDRFEDVIRFNEAIDEALAESISFFSTQVEQSRNLLLGMLGHDLRSPLQSIQMTATYLAALNAGAQVSDAAARLINSGSRMKALLDDLLDFNRTKFGLGVNINPTPMDASKVFDDELRLLRAAHANRQIDFEVAGDTNGVWDAMRLRQVLNNLVVNAIKYGADDTPVRVALSGDPEQLSFEVRNKGSTIDRETLDIIFEPLRRIMGQEPRYDGEGSLGLGLYIARQIAEAHRGTIEARSDSTQTVFAVRVPRSRPSIIA